MTQILAEFGAIYGIWSKFGANKVVTITFKRHLGLAKFSGVVVCSPRLGWAVVSYLDFTTNPLTLEHIGTNLPPNS